MLLNVVSENDTATHW